MIISYWLMTWAIRGIYKMVDTNGEWFIFYDLIKESFFTSVRGMQVPRRYPDQCQGYAGTPQVS